MFRSRVGLLMRPAFSGAALTGHRSAPLAALTTAARLETTATPPQRARPTGASPSGTSGASSFSRKMRMASASPDVSPASATTERVRTVPPPSAADAEEDAENATPVRKVVKKKKIIKKVLRRPGGETEVLSTETVNTGEALRRELRDYRTANASAGQDEPSAAADVEEDATPTAAATTSPSSAAAAAASEPKAQKTSLVKGYKIDEVMSLCTPSDAIFARRLPSGGCQFFAWPGTPLEVASAAIVSMPDTIRTVHAVFGRYRTPIDIVMDIDCPVPQEHWSMTKIRPFQKKLLDDTLSVLSEEIAKIGEKIETQVVLQSPNLKKASFHVHTKLKDAAFEDFNSLHGFLARFHDRMPSVDLQIYRHNGMLRMFSCMKENHTSAMTVFDEPEWNIGFKDGKVPDEAAALHSVVVRPAGTFKRLLKFEPPRGAQTYSHGASASTTQSAEGGASRPMVLLPRTEREAVENASRWLRKATEAEVSEWRSWIGLGICAFRIGYQFKDAPLPGRSAMEEMLDAWIEASRHCPSKFRVGDCEHRWSTFDIQKLSTSSDWWSSYIRIGRLEGAAQENVAEDRARQAKRWSYPEPSQTSKRPAGGKPAKK